MHYQALVDLRRRRVVGFEALIRWQHPTRGLVWPDTFIEVAEECGMLVQIGEWALRRACQNAVRWNRDIRVAVNVSSQQFQAPDFPQLVEAALAEAGLPAERLELEITERVILGDSETVRSAVTRLRARGVRISLDDFGTGYSSLSYLHKFAIDGIKIDRSFVGGLGTTDEAEAIVRAMVSLGKILGMRTLAERIETEEQAERVLAARCMEGQGFLFSRPVSLGDVEAVIEKLSPERKMSWALSEIQPTSEIKGLANQTKKATRDISNQLEELQAATNETVPSIESITQTIEQLSQIASSIEEQGSATLEIARNVQKAPSGTQHVSANIVGASQGFQETGAASEQVLAATGELAKQAETLRAGVSVFIADVKVA